MSSKKLNPFKDFQSDQIQRSSRKIFTAHYACRNAAMNLTPVTGTTNGFIFQMINSLIESFWVSLNWLCCKRWIFCVFLRYLQYQLVQIDAPATSTATISGLNFLCLFQSAEIQIPVNI